MKRLAKRIIKKAFAMSGYEIVGTENAGTLSGHLKQVFDLLDINCVLDVGANEGQYGRLLRKMGYKGIIVSFEPVQKAYALLQQGVKDDDAWYSFNYALGGENVVKALNITSGSDLSSFLTLSNYGIKTLGRYRNNDKPVTETEDTKHIEIKRLDAVFESIIQGIENPRIFLKMDTQGYDLEVMKGAENCLDKIFGIQSEISVLPLYNNMPDYLQSLRVFTDLGYALTGLYTVIREPETLKIVEYDCVMIREG